MTLGDIATKARTLVNASTDDYTDANLLIDINLWYQKVVTMILEAADSTDFDDGRNTTYPILTTPMVASQRDYSIPVSNKVLKIKRVDVTYDGTNWYKAEPIDDGEIYFGLGNDTTTDQNFYPTTPRYDVKYNSIFLYPMPSATDVANGGTMRIEWERQITPFDSGDYTTVLTDSTVVPGFDDPFHPMLAYGAAFEQATSRQLPQLAQITSELADYETRLRVAYGRKDWDRRLLFKPDYLDIDYR